MIRHTIENEALYPCRGRFLSSKIFRRNSFLSFRAFRGRPVVVTVRINTGQNRQTEDFEYPCHSNETWGQIRRMISNRYVDLSDLRNHKQKHFSLDIKLPMVYSNCIEIMISFFLLMIIKL